jgi:hypothetical protein
VRRRSAVSSIVSGRPGVAGWPRVLRPLQYTVAPASPNMQAMPRPAARVAPATTAILSVSVRSAGLAIPLSSLGFCATSLPACSCDGIIDAAFQCSRHPVRKKPFTDAAVESVFDAYPRDVRKSLMEVRRLIFDTAAASAGVGELEETLRWGEPSYLTSQSKSGSMVRMHWKASDGDHYKIYFHCQTNLVATFRELYPGELQFDGNRSIRLKRSAAIPVDALRHCIGLALTYHLDRRARNRA